MRLTKGACHGDRSERHIAVDWAVNSKVFGERARPRVVGAYALAFVITLGVVNAWLHPFHRVRVRDGDCKPVALPNQRPTVGAAAGAWYAQANPPAKVHGEGPVPMLVVATAGGGIRAAYWTATILERLEADRRVFLPDLGQGDRGSALEKSFEHASDGLLARPFLSFFHLAKDSVANEGQESWRPILLLNATHEESGNRIITARSVASSAITAKAS